MQRYLPDPSEMDRLDMYAGRRAALNTRIWTAITQTLYLYSIAFSFTKEIFTAVKFPLGAGFTQEGFRAIQRTTSLHVSALTVASREAGNRSAMVLIGGLL
ncbi:hypothetical protein XENOCAPTIV_026378 [Xenoophorus captivus]|uniref:Uncharacterized protein n=1 Tax=Xenoophorus captivus TaxID=1517983 RepID=A0ABV0SDE3_9TELE